MKRKKTIIGIAFFLLGLGGLQAQEALPATGGGATGSGGKISYTVGQVAYTANGTNGSVTQGVQQSYVISTVLGAELTNINLEVLVYPNPTTNYLTLKVDNVEFVAQSELNFQLYDMQGKLLRQKKIVGSSTTIKMEGLRSAIYFLMVLNNQSTVKTFRVIKN